MIVFSPAQVEDLRALQRICHERQVEIVIIGATAYRLFVNDIERETLDIDLAVALDLGGLEDFARALSAIDWHKSERHEQRWKTARGTWIDILPAGPALRAQGRLEWPGSGLTMRLAGFEHAFRDSVDVELAAGVRFKVVTPPVLALLKMAAYLDDPYGRAKDLVDFRRLLHHYARDTDRVFSDEVFAADLSDIEFASAFLLGLDMQSIAAPNDLQLIESFLTGASQALQNAPWDDLEGRTTAQFHNRISAFRKGLSHGL
jgi:predicted nucleotidyltransferase